MKSQQDVELDPRIPRLLSQWQSASAPKPSAEQLCADCPELVPQVAQMIGALGGVHAETNLPGFRDTSDGVATAPTSTDFRAPPDFESPCAVSTPTHIGAYRILATLGAGGMGVVYKGEQRHPVKRLVAIKLIKLGMDTRHVIARFESERQALALMDHPNVAKVLDAGATEAGRPYFVMEYVPGEPITDYCDRNRLTTEDRLALFMQVCDAVQHAHQKGIIHRDLKPGNVLVEYRDGKAVPKVIDFGIAKATSSALTGMTLYTEHGQMIGTPEYVSPEQAETSGLDVDTRTDIYSLGVMLFELLTGTLPFDPKELRTMTYAQMQQTIRDTDPPKPSTKLTKLTGEQIATIAKHRRVEPRTLSRQIRGELDWIVLKAMEKDRSRRYEAAAALSMDIARYLRDEPVSAGPPTATYRVSKFMKRHVVGLTAGAAVVSALLLGLGLAIFGFYEARAQRDEAIRLKAVADTARAQAEAASHLKDDVNTYLQEMLAAVNPEHASVMDVTLDNVLKRSRELFGENKPLIGAVLASRASALRSAGQLDEAQRAYNEALVAFREAHGHEHATVAATLASLGQVYVDRGDFAAAERPLREALEIKKKVFGPRSREVADAMFSLTYALSQRKDQTPQHIAELRKLALEQNEITRAAYGATDRRTLEVLSLNGIWLYSNRFLDDAEPVLLKVYEHRALLGNSQILLAAMDRLTKIYVERQDVAAARPVYLELNDSIQLMLGAGNPLSVQTAVGLASWLSKVRDTTAAEEVLRRAITAASAMTPRGDPLLTDAKRSLIDLMLKQKNPDKKAIRDLLLEYLEDRRVQPGTTAAQLARHQLVAAGHLADWGYTLEAEDLYRDALPALKSADPVDQSAVAEAMVGYGSSMLRNGRAAQAEPILREALELRRQTEREGHWMIAQAQSALGECLIVLGRPDDAAPMLEEACDMIDATRQVPPHVKLRALEALSRLYAMQGNTARVNQLQQKITATSRPAGADDATVE